MNLFSRIKWVAIATAIGLIAGWAYWYFVGCSSGSCAITFNPYNSMGYGALMGILLTWDTAKKKKHESAETTSGPGSKNELS